MKADRCGRGRILITLTMVIIFVAVGCSTGDGDFQPSEPDYEVQFPHSNAGRVTITQGIWADVWFWQGDFMPFFPTGTVTGVAREMRIHELTSLNQVDFVGHTAFYSAIHTRLVSTARSDENGFFEVSLPTGHYSLFAVEDGLFYSNEFDGSGHVWPVVVNAGEVTHVCFNIDYMATF